MELQDFLGLAGVPVIVAAVEGFKRVWPDAEERWYPAVALAVSLVVNGLVAWRLNVDPVLAALLAVVASFAASGLYSQAKTVAGE